MLDVVWIRFVVKYKTDKDDNNSKLPTELNLVYEMASNDKFC